MGWFRMPYTKEQELLERSQAMIVTDGSRKITKKEFYDEAIIWDEETEYPWYELLEEEPAPLGYSIQDFHNVIEKVKSELGLYEANYSPGRENIMLFEIGSELYVDFRWRENKIVILNGGIRLDIENLSKVKLNKIKKKILCMK